MSGTEVTTDSLMAIIRHTKVTMGRRVNGTDSVRVDVEARHEHLHQESTTYHIQYAEVSKRKPLPSIVGQRHTCES